MNKYMNIAYKEALKAYKKGEIPVGAVITYNGKIIAKAYNTRQSNYTVIGHAEINCILKAEKKIKDWRLDNCEMYVTLEPCNMCKEIIKESRINSIYYLLNKDYENINSNITQTNDCIKLKEEYRKLLKKFFLELRNNS